VEAWGAIEAGGTKFVCAVGTGPEQILAEKRIPTGSPYATLSEVIAFFAEQQRKGVQLRAVGVGSFGPLVLDPTAPDYGCIVNTPKPEWSGLNVLRPLERNLGVPVRLETDVNAALWGEWRWGAARGLSHVLYMTVGTGIGGAALVQGHLLQGAWHPEMGHLRLPRDPEDNFPGVCPYHGACLEGLASGPALKARWNVEPFELPTHHQAWALEARYLALALVNLIVTLVPQRIILGGGVMQQMQLFPLIRKQVKTLLGGYLRLPELLHTQLETYIVPPLLGQRAGLLGALALAMETSAS